MIDLTEIKKTFNGLVNYNEENVKIKVIIELFKKLGYEFESFVFEHPVYHKDKRVDFIIEMPNKEVIYVETKRGDRDLNGRDIVQLATYLHTRNIEWGFLCNGKRLILLNNNIRPSSQDETALEDTIVFDINIYSVRDSKYLQFATQNALTKTKITNFFRDIAQFRALRFPLGSGSWNVYRGTLVNFFFFYAEREKKYRPLEQIRIDDFEEFLRNDQLKKNSMKKSVNSEKTFNNKYSHLRSMFIELKKNKMISSHHFEEERHKLIGILETSDVSKSQDVLTIDNLKTITNFLGDSDNSERDITVLLLCIFLGIERSTIKSLRWDMFNPGLDTIEISGRKIGLPPKIVCFLDKLREQNSKKRLLLRSSECELII